jgi:hypothetical protein
MRVTQLVLDRYDQKKLPVSPLPMWADSRSVAVVMETWGWSVWLL